MNDVNRVLPFGAWLLRQARVRKVNRGMEEPLASYFKNFSGPERIVDMDVAQFAEFLQGWTYYYNAFAAAAQEYLTYVQEQITTS